MIKVSKKGLSNGEPLELIKLSYLLNKEKFISEFNKVKVKIESALDLDNLANIVKAKLDVSGKIKEKDSDNVIMFDTMRILSNVKYTNAEKLAVINDPNNFTE